jgi:CHAD domain-containing protein
MMGKTETERKYVADSAIPALPPLTDLPHVAAATAEDQQNLDAEYYDTSDLRLIRAGATLRRRYGGSDEGWHLKLPSGPDSRRELHHPIGEPGSVVPDELASLARAYSRGAPLGPVAHISTTRRRRVLHGDDETPLAEVVLDDVSAQTLGEATVISRWQEAEVELLSGDRQLLDAADERLRESGFRPAGYGSKLARALEDRLAEAGPAAEMEAGSTAADVVLWYLRDQAAALRGYDAAVRLSEPDSVHQMRVTCRRLRAALQSFRIVLAEDAARYLNEELRWLGQQLGSARDAEVLAERYRAELRELPDELVLGPVQARVQAHFAPLRGEAERMLLEALDSDRYLELLGELDQLLTDPPVTDEASRPAGEVLPGAVARAYKRVKKRMRQAAQAADGQARDVALHEARKAAKRARYAAEALVPIGGKAAGKFAKQMKKVQSVLGDHQDAVMARQRARELGVQAFLASENGFTFGVLYGLEEQNARRLAEHGWQVWKCASKRKYRGWLS